MLGMSAASLTTYQVRPAFASPISPSGDDWGSPDFLELVVDKDPRVHLRSHYDRENNRFVEAVLESDFDLQAVVDEMGVRAWHHSRYFDGDHEYNGIRNNLLCIYNGLAAVCGKASFESQFNSKPDALAHACRVLDSNPGTPRGKAGLQQARDQVKLKIERNDLFVPVLGELPAAGLYWIEFVIHDDEHEGKGSYHNFFGQHRSDVFIQLYVPESPAHVRYYPVIRDGRTYNSLLEDFPHTDILGWELANQCDNPRYQTPSIWHLVTKPALKL